MGSKEDDNALVRATVFICVVIAGFVVPIIVWTAMEIQQRQDRREAVERGAAEWICGTDGTPLFRWRLKPVAEKVSE